MEDYQEIAKDCRKKTLELVYKAQTSHIGSCFSVIDIASVLFSKVDLDRDRVIFSCGWKAAVLYYFLWKKGRITEEELNSFCQPGSKFIGLSEPFHPDIPVAGGSMGVGFPMAVGMSLAKKLKNEEGRIYVIMSDGEMVIGSTYEAALIAAQHKLDNLIVIVDCNGLQAMGRVEDILDPWEGYRPLWYQFGWKNREIDGHDYKELDMALNKKSRRVIFAKTTKGKGISFMADDNSWHYRNLDDRSYELAQKELG